MLLGSLLMKDFHKPLFQDVDSESLDENIGKCLLTRQFWEKPLSDSCLWNLRSLHFIAKNGIGRVCIQSPKVKLNKENCFFNHRGAESLLHHYSTGF